MVIQATIKSQGCKSEAASLHAALKANGSLAEPALDCAGWIG
jgi:hypothetical protein